MQAHGYQRNTIIDVVVRGHAHYGVLVTTPSGEPGWIEAEYLDDVRVAPTDWPPVGSVVIAAVLGPMTRDGRWRLCSRPSCIAAARDADHSWRSILWWRVAAGYGWSIVVGELAASPRWSAETKAKAGVFGGVAISFPVTFGIGLPYVYWLLTGKGPWRRYGFSSAVVVNPFRRRMPPDVRAALSELQEERAAEACPVPSRARP